MSEQEAQAEAWVAWDAAQYTTPPSFGGKRLANVSAADAFYAGWDARAEWERARHVPAEVTNEMVERAAFVLAEVTGEPRAGRFERTMARSVLLAALGGDTNG